VPLRSLAKRFKLLRGLAYEENAIKVAKEKLKRDEINDTPSSLMRSGGPTVTREGLQSALNSSGGTRIAELLGVEGGDEVDSIIRMFDSDNNGELDAEESQMLVDMIQKRAHMTTPRPVIEPPANAAWPLRPPAPTPAESRALIAEHFEKHHTRPLYAPGELTLEDRVAALAEQSSVLAHMVADHNTSTVKAIDELDAMLAVVSTYMAQEQTIMDRVANLGKIDLGLSTLLASRAEEPAADPTLPLLPDRAGGAASARGRGPPPGRQPS
jgi:hypothetical protein